MTALRRLLRVLVITVSVLIGVLVVALIATQTHWFKDWLRRYMTRQANDYLNAELRVGRLGGNLVTGVELEEVSVVLDGETVLAIKDVGLEYNVLDFVSQGLVIDRLRLNNPRVVLRRTADGWNVARLVKEQRAEADREGPARPVRIADIAIADGLVRIDDRMAADAAAVRLPQRLEDIDVHGRFAYEPVSVSLQLAKASARAVQPDLRLNVTGALAVQDDEIVVEDLWLSTPESSLVVEGRVDDYDGTPRIDLAATTGRIVPGELAGFVPALADLPIEPAVELTASGTIRDLRVDANLRSDAGSATAHVRGDLASETPAVRGEARVTGLDAGRLLARPDLASDVNASATFDLRGAGLEDLRGRVRVESGPSRAAGYKVDSLRADATLRGPTIALDGRARAYGAALSVNGSITRPESEGDTPTYDLRGRIEQADLRRLPLPAGTPRLATNVTGAYHVRGKGPAIVSNVRLNRSSIEGATISEGTTAMLDLSGETPSYAARGAIAAVDPQRIGRALGREDLAGPGMAGTVNARFDVEGRGTTLDGLEVRADVQAYDSRLGGIDVPHFVARGAVAGGIARLDALQLASSAVTAEASGVVALKGDANSSLGYTAEVRDIAALGALFGVADAGGTARVEGAIEGTHQRLRTEGKLSALNLRYGTTSMVSLSSQYGIELPNLDVQQMTGEADTVATLLQVGGREIREVTAKTGYASPRLVFDTTISEAECTVRARGEAELLADAQTLRLDELVLQTGDVRWGTPAGAPSTIRYANRQIAVDRLALANGDQHLEVGGTVYLGPAGSEAAAPEPGPPTGTLTVTAQNVDIGEIDDLLVGDRGLGGRLQADITLTGSLQAPAAEGRLRVDDGAFRDFRFQFLDGRAEYDERGVRLDVRLQQSPEAWLTAAGTVPVAALQADTTPAPGAYPLDIQARSSPIDLGLLQGLSPAVQDAKGTLTADVRVTGDLREPVLDGEILVQQGALSLVPIGTKYEQLDARLTLAGNRITIDRFHVVDDDGDPLTLAGGVTLRGAQLADLDVQAKGTGFSLANNRLAEMEVDLDMRARGEPTSLVVEGEVKVTNGRIEVDRVLELVQTGLYSTETGAASTPAQEEGAGPSAMTFDVRLRVPENLVLRGDDIRIGGQGVPIGNMNVTVGGDLRVAQSPSEPLRVKGEVTTVRGFYEFQGRRFEVQRGGRIAFEGPDPMDPLIDVTGVRDIAGIEAQVRIQGSAREPRLVLASTPPLDDADILSLIVFNRPTNDLGQGERAALSQQAQSLVGGMLANPLAESLRDALDVDMLEIEAVSQDGDGPAVTLGDQLGERVFLQFRQLFGSGQATEVLLEYEIYEFLRLQTSFAEGVSDSQAAGGQQERAGVDLLFTVEK